MTTAALWLILYGSAYHTTPQTDMGNQWNEQNQVIGFEYKSLECAKFQNSFYRDILTCNYGHRFNKYLSVKGGYATGYWNVKHSFYTMPVVSYQVGSIKFDFSAMPGVAIMLIKIRTE